MGEYKFQIYKRLTIRGWRWYFRFKAPNGEIMFPSEGYNRIEGATHAIKVIKAYAGTARTEVVEG